MYSNQRSSLWGAIEKYRLVIALFLILISMSIWTHEMIKELKQINDCYSTTINKQTETIEELKLQNTELNTYISQLEEEIDKLKSQVKKTTVVSAKGSFKSYTDYQLLSRNSPQWKLQQQAYTDKNGLRKIGDAYLVALGSYYGKTLGTKYEVTLSNGNTFKIILCDVKSDKHTDSKNQTCLSNGSILEFYVETSKLPKAVKTSGTVGSIKFFSGNIVSIKQVK